MVPPGSASYCLVTGVPQCLSCWKPPKLLLPLRRAGRQPADDRQEQAIGVPPGMSLDFLYCPFSFCTLQCSALCSNTVLPPCWPSSVGNSSECPPPGNAPDDTVCVDMGKCKDGECVPFCEREKNLRSCACNGRWHGTELKRMLRLCSLESAGLTVGLPIGGVSLGFLKKFKLLVFQG